MRRIAREVGYSETAFLVPAGDRGPVTYDVRYFAPATEISFCGHATIAAGVLLGTRTGPGRYLLRTAAGPVPVTVALDGGEYTATLTSVAPTITAVSPAFVEAVLDTFGWTWADLDPLFTPAIAYAGASHLILVAGHRRQLAQLTYDFRRLLELMQPDELATVSVLWREDLAHFHARNLFPPGGVIEDPATGAAAAAFGAYLRAFSHLVPPKRVTISQGEDMGRPSLIHVSIPPGSEGVAVSGTAVAIVD